MEQAIPVTVVVEGVTDEIVVTNLLRFVGLHHNLVLGKNGKPDILKKLYKYNEAARHSTWLVCVDLDNSASCAPAFLAKYLPEPSRHMNFRVAVRAVEAWLLADAPTIAAYLGVTTNAVPNNPDELLDPKETLINLARRSRRISVTREMVPRPGSGARVGPGYVGQIGQYVMGTRNQWRPEVAAEHSPSLRRCIDALRAIRASVN